MPQQLSFAKKRVKGLVSVVMGVYNCAPFVAGALKTILNQSYKKLEIIIVDDGSRDDTWNKINAIKDPRIIALRLPKNHGPSRPRNIALSLSRGEFITFFDGDDLMLPGAILARVRFLTKNPSVHAVFGYAKHSIDSKGRVLKPPFAKEIKNEVRFFRLLKTLPPSILKKFIVYNIRLTTFMVRHHAIQKAGFLDESYIWCEDREYAFRLAKIAPLHFIDAPILRYRMHPQNLTHRISKRLKKRNLLKILRLY